MKFSILNILMLTAIAGLGVALYVEHSRNAQLESEQKLKHQEEMQRQKEGLAVRYGVTNLFLVRDLMDSPSVRLDYDAAALGLIVSIFDNANFLDLDSEFRAEHGEIPAITVVAKLLKQLDCHSVEDYLRRYGQKMKMLGMNQDFQLGADDSDRRQDFIAFIRRALSENE